MNQREFKSGVKVQSLWQVFNKKNHILGYHLFWNQFNSYLSQTQQGISQTELGMGVNFDFGGFEFSGSGEAGTSSQGLPVFEQYRLGGEGSLAGYHFSELLGNSYFGWHIKIKTRLAQFDLGFLKHIDAKVFYDQMSVSQALSTGLNQPLEGWGFGFEADSISNFVAKMNFEFAQNNRSLVFFGFGNQF